MQSIIACIDECDMVKPITLYTNLKKFKSIILVYKGIGVWRLPAPSCGQFFHYTILSEEESITKNCRCIILFFLGLLNQKELIFLDL